MFTGLSKLEFGLRLSYFFRLISLLLLVVYGRTGTTRHIMGTAPPQTTHINAPPFAPPCTAAPSPRNHAICTGGCQDEERA